MVVRLDINGAALSHSLTVLQSKKVDPGLWIGCRTEGQSWNDWQVDLLPSSILFGHLWSFFSKSIINSWAYESEKGDVYHPLIHFSLSLCLKDCLRYCLWSIHKGQMCYLFVHLFIHWLDVAASCTHISSPQWLKCCLHQPVAALSSSLILAKPAGLLPCFHSHFPHSVLCSKWGI